MTIVIWPVNPATTAPRLSSTWRIGCCDSSVPPVELPGWRKNASRAAGSGVLVEVLVGVGVIVGVLVLGGTFVGALVGVLVGVAVIVPVGVAVGVAVGVLVIVSDAL